VSGRCLRVDLPWGHHLTEWTFPAISSPRLQLIVVNQPAVRFIHIELNCGKGGSRPVVVGNLLESIEMHQVSEEWKHRGRRDDERHQLERATKQ
jgi:hypothetical protein